MSDHYTTAPTTKFGRFCEFHMQYVREYGEYQRAGQALYNALRTFDPAIEEHVWDGHLDTFDNDGAIPALWSFIATTYEGVA